MAALRKIGRLSSFMLSANKRYYAKKLDIDTKPPYTEYWKPGPYPNTKEEQLKAAERYGMHPREYKPMSSEEDSCGDYPDIKAVGYDARDPTYPYDIPVLRKNWNETVTEGEDLYGGDCYSSEGVRRPYDDYKAGLAGFGMFLVIVWILYLQEPPHNAVMEKQYLQPGRKHYTFEPAR